jgi:hypothetical protein
VSFSAASCKKKTKNGAAVTSLRTFVRSNGFITQCFFKLKLNKLFLVQFEADLDLTPYFGKII